MYIDTDAVSGALRKKALDLKQKRLLFANYNGSGQEKDFTRPANCQGCGRIRHFRRKHTPGWPDDPLPMDPCARRLGLSKSDSIEAQLFQVAYCNWRCWYCYVPEVLLSADHQHAKWLAASDLLDLFQQENGTQRIIDISGGQPDITPEWLPWLITEVKARNLDSVVYLWSDDNLSTDYFWSYLSKNEIESVREYHNYGKVCCFKGFDEESFSFNTLASQDQFALQFSRFARFLTLGIDLYAYATFTSPDDRNIGKRMAQFCDRLQLVSENLPLRLVPLEIIPFSPMRARMHQEHERALKVQWVAIECWKYELKARFSDELLRRGICDIPL